MPTVPRPDQRTGPLIRRRGEYRQAAGGGSGLSMKARSRDYLDMLSGIDAATAAARADTTAVRDRVAAEIAASTAQLPLGIVARCRLGGSYVVHTLTWDLEDVVIHYKRHEPLPAELECARALAASGSYLAVEVYPEHLLCLRPDGTVVKVER